MNITNTNQESMNSEHMITIEKEKRLHCRTCGQDFIWTVGEQRFYALHT